MTGKLRDCGRMQATIEGIAKVHDFDLYAPADGESLILTNEPYQDLHICRYGENIISIAHWREDYMERIADPEIIFHVAQNNSTNMRKGEWYPMAIRQVPVAIRSSGGDVKVLNDGGWKDCLEFPEPGKLTIWTNYGEIVSFAQDWSTNIRRQKFYTPEKKNKHGLYAAPKKERRIEPVVEEALPEPEEPKRVKFVTLKLEL